MKLEEAIKELQNYADTSWGSLNEAFEMAIDALHPVSWEKVVQAWRGQWVKCKHADYYVCNKCSTVSKTGEDEFCKSCGAPMTGEAVQILLKRLDALHEKTD